MRGMMKAFTAEGLNLERMVRQAGEAGIVLLGMRRIGDRKMTGCAMIEDLPALTDMARVGGWHLTLGGERGLARMLAAIRRRWLVCVLCISAIMLTGAASTMMWNISLKDAGTYDADIRAYLAETGICPPMRKRDVDLSQLRDALEWRYPRVAWIECGWRGIGLTIRVVEGAQGDEPIALTGQRNVIAHRSGVVTSIVTLAGTPQVKAGQTVTAGQTLILGEERGKDGAVQPVSARGTVLARVWDGASVRISGSGIETTYTGREHTSMQMVTPWMALWEEEASPFASSDVEVETMPVGGIFLPVWIRRVTRHEAEHMPVPLDRAEIMAQAEAIAWRKLGEKTGFKQEFVDKWIDYSMIENGDIMAVAIGERIIDIGAYP